MLIKHMKNPNTIRTSEFAHLSSCDAFQRGGLFFCQGQRLPSRLATCR
jgi:hypothetical protein